jgi:DNA-binding CsgD family transcriptional regulator
MEGPLGIPIAHQGWFAIVEREASVRVLILDEDFRFRFISKAAIQFLNFPSRDMIGVSAFEVMPREHAEERKKLNDRLIESRSSVTLVETLRGWKCRNRVCYFGQDDRGKHLVAVVIQPECLQPIDHSGGPVGEVLYMSDADAAIFAKLSKTELRVLTLIGEGLSTQQIAERFGRSAKTIEGHRHAIGKKLGAPNRVELARIAIRAGLSSLEPRDEGAHAPNEAAWTRLPRLGPPPNGLRPGGRRPPAS